MRPMISRGRPLGRVAARCAFSSSDRGSASPARAQAPADYGPVSANVEEIPYPYPVSYVPFVLYGQDVRMAYMDVKPTGARERANRRAPARLQLLRRSMARHDRRAHARRVPRHRTGPDRLWPIVEAVHSVHVQRHGAQHATPAAIARRRSRGDRRAFDGRNARVALRDVVSGRDDARGDGESDRAHRRAPGARAALSRRRVSTPTRATPPRTYEAVRRPSLATS